MSTDAAARALTLREPRIRATRTGAAPSHFVHVDDLVDAILAALDNPATPASLQLAMDEPSTMPPSPLISRRRGPGPGSVDIPAPIIPTGSTASDRQTILRMPSR